MKVLNPRFDLKKFYEELKTDTLRILGLDYDGTLAPFKVDPTQAVPYQGIREVLNKVIKNPLNRVAIISGRGINDLLMLVDLAQRPEIWGSHGLERLKAGGHYEQALVPAEALEGMTKIEAWLTSLESGTRLEKKPGCIALHWRGLDRVKMRDYRGKVMYKFQQVAAESGMMVHEFDGGIELRIAGKNKGDAIRTLISESDGKTIPVFLGDDLTDENGFQTVKGQGVGILVRTKFRKTSADIWIKPPGELIKFLSNFI